MAKKKSKTRVVIQARPSKKKQNVSQVGQLIRSLGSLGGSALGGVVGLPAAGGAAGNSLGAALSKWMGFGDYTVSTNSIVSKASTQIPAMHKEGQTVVIRHREFLTTVRSSTNFALQNSFTLNPGNSTTFPWLSTIAASFQEYRWKGLVFHYIPTSGSAISGTSPSLGSVMMQTSYRSTDSPPSNKAELLNEYWSGEAVPSETFAHPIECDPKENPFNVQYVRTGAVPDGDSSLIYDLGVTHVCTQGQLAANNTLGDIWVTYEVELKKPVVTSNVTTRTKVGMLTAYAPSFTTGLLSGTRSTRGNLSLTASSNTTLTFAANQPGKYAMWMALTGVGITGPPVISLALTNVNTSGLDVDDQTSFQAGGSTTIIAATGFTVTDGTLASTFTFSLSAATFSSLTQFDIMIYKMSD